MIGAIAATAGGLYIVVNQDTSHGEAHGGHGQHHDEEHKLEAPAAEEAKEEKKEEAAPKEEEEKATEEKEEAPKEEKGEGESKKPSDTDKVGGNAGFVMTCMLNWRSPTPRKNPRARRSSPESRMPLIPTRILVNPWRNMLKAATIRARRERVLQRPPRLRELFPRTGLR